jgi:hypothetical protein
MDTITADGAAIVTEIPVEAVVAPEEVETDLNEEVEESQETDTETEETEEGEDGGKPKKLSASERVQEAVNAARDAKAEAARVAEENKALKGQFEEWQGKYKPPVEPLPYVQIDVGQFERHLTALEDKAEQLAISDDPQERLESRRLLRERDSYIAAYEENQKLKADYEGKQAEINKETAELTAREQKLIADFNNSAEFYKQKTGMSDEVWTAAGQWLDAQFKADPLLVEEFRDRAKASGAIPTIKWLHRLASEGMAKEAAGNKATKEQTKQTTVGGSNATAVHKSTTTLPADADMNAWVKAREAELKKRK